MEIILGIVVLYILYIAGEWLLTNLLPAVFIAFIAFSLFISILYFFLQRQNKKIKEEEKNKDLIKKIIGTHFLKFSEYKYDNLDNDECLKILDSNFFKISHDDTINMKNDVDKEQKNVDLKQKKINSRNGKIKKSNFLIKGVEE